MFTVIINCLFNKVFREKPKKFLLESDQQYSAPPSVCRRRGLFILLSTAANH